MNVSTDIAVWIMAFIMLSLFSFLYKENPAFSIAENIYVGAGAGHMIAMGYRNIMGMAVHPLREQGQWSMIIPLLLGLMLYTRFTRRYAFLSRYGLALPIGMGAGLALRALPAAQVLSQVRATLVDLTNVDNLVLMVGVVCTLIFFLFTTAQNNFARQASKLGKYFMLVTFGLTFATAVFQHIGIYFGSLQLLLGTWLGII
jgi:hypothetical protein